MGIVDDALRLLAHVCSPRAMRVAVCGAVLLPARSAPAAPLSVLDPAGPDAAAIADLWWIMFIAGVLLLGLVVGLALLFVTKPPGGRTVAAPLLLWGGGIALPLLLLAPLLAYGFVVGERQSTTFSQATAEVHAHRWWWEFIYPDVDGAPLYTAYKLHIPAGETVRFRVHSADVIHSFWVPRLGRKMDAVPGQTNEIELFADRPGTYQGQCSEFCGTQHAGMRFIVQAHEPADFAARLRAMADSRPDPAHPGAALFQTHCAACHSADPRDRGHGAPNLAGIAERDALGSGVLSTSSASSVRQWLTEHGRVKPGSLMPEVELGDRDVQLLSEYLTR